MLRSTKEIEGYTLRAIDGDIGHCKDFLFDDQSWVIRYMVADTGSWLTSRKVLISPVDTRNWLPGRKVLIAPDWLTRFHADSRKAELDLTREQIEKSPEYVPGAPVNRSYETRLYDFYGRPVYWD